MPIADTQVKNMSIKDESGFLFLPKPANTSTA